MAVNAPCLDFFLVCPGSRPFLSRRGWGCSGITFWLSVQMEKRGQKQGDDAVFSDHVLFELSLQLLCFCLAATYVRPWTVLCWSGFDRVDTQSALLCFNTEEFTSFSHSTWQNILDSVAPFKVMCSKPKAERCIRREHRRAEHQWKKDELQIKISEIFERSKHKICFCYNLKLSQTSCSF